MPWSGSSTSWASLASTVQSKPPENNTATRVLPSANGGVGISRTLRLKDTTSCCLSMVTERDDAVNAQLPEGSALLNLPMPETWK